MIASIAHLKFTKSFKKPALQQKSYKVFHLCLSLPIAILSTFSSTLSSPSPSFALEKTSWSSGRSRQRRRLREEVIVVVVVGGEVGLHGRRELVLLTFMQLCFLVEWGQLTSSDGFGPGPSPESPAARSDSSQPCPGPTF